MTPRLRVGDRAICVTEDTWDGSEVEVYEVLEDGYEAGSPWGTTRFRFDELVPVPPAPPREPSRIAWVRTNLPWMLAALAVGAIAALVIAALGSEGAL